MIEKCPQCGNALVSKNSGDVVVDGLQRKITWVGRPVKLTPKQFNIVHMLLESAGAPVHSSVLFNKFFSINATPANLPVTISIIKKAFRNVDPSFDRIKNSHSFGYLWVTE